MKHLHNEEEYDEPDEGVVEIEGEMDFFEQECEVAKEYSDKYDEMFFENNDILVESGDVEHDNFPMLRMETESERRLREKREADREEIEKQKIEEQEEKHRLDCEKMKKVLGDSGGWMKQTVSSSSFKNLMELEQKKKKEERDKEEIRVEEGEVNLSVYSRYDAETKSFNLDKPWLRKDVGYEHRPQYKGKGRGRGRGRCEYGRGNIPSSSTGDDLPDENCGRGRGRIMVNSSGLSGEHNGRGRGRGRTEYTERHDRVRMMPTMSEEEHNHGRGRGRTGGHNRERVIPTTDEETKGECVPHIGEDCAKDKGKGRAELTESEVIMHEEMGHNEWSRGGRGRGRGWAECVDGGHGRGRMMQTTSEEKRTWNNISHGEGRGISEHVGRGYGRGRMMSTTNEERTEGHHENYERGGNRGRGTSEYVNVGYGRGRMMSTGNERTEGQHENYGGGGNRGRGRRTSEHCNVGYGRGRMMLTTHEERTEGHHENYGSGMSIGSGIGVPDYTERGRGRGRTDGHENYTGSRGGMGRCSGINRESGSTASTTGFHEEKNIERGNGGRNYGRGTWHTVDEKHVKNPEKPTGDGFTVVRKK